MLITNQNKQVVETLTINRLAADKVKSMTSNKGLSKVKLKCFLFGGVQLSSR